MMQNYYIYTYSNFRATTYFQHPAVNCSSYPSPVLLLPISYPFPESFALASSFPFPNAKIRPPHCGLRMIAKIFLCRILCACYPAVCATRAHSVRYSATVLQFKKWLSPNKKIILYLYIYIFIYRYIDIGFKIGDV